MYFLLGTSKLLFTISNKCIPVVLLYKYIYPTYAGQRKFFHEQPVSSRTVIWARSDQTRVRAQPSSRSDINTFASLSWILLGPVNRVQLLVHLEPSPILTRRASKRGSIFNFAFPLCMCMCVCVCRVASRVAKKITVYREKHWIIYYLWLRNTNITSLWQ